MVIGIGCDIVDHNESVNLKWDSDIAIQKRIFTKKELEIYSQKRDIRFLAGRFAAKEAILKCLGTGMQDGIALTDIEILQSESGKSIVEFFDEIKKISNEIGVNFWHISITHSSNQSIAFVVAERI